MLAALAPRLSAARAGRPWLDIDLDHRALPLDALAFVEAHGLRQRMYNDFELGGYLAWTGYPRFRVFTDPRLPAYPRSFHAVMGRGDLTRAEWDAVMDRHGVDSALLSYAGINRRLAWWDPARWALVYRAGRCARVRAPPAPPRGADRRPGDPGQLLVHRRGRDPHRAAGRPARHVAGRRLRVAAAPGRSAVRAGRRRSHPRAGRLPPRPGGAPGLSRSRPHRRRARLGGHHAAGPRGCPPRRWTPWIARWRPTATNERLLASRALALETLGRRSEARAGWLQLADRAADAPLARRARDHAARLQPPAP